MMAAQIVKNFLVLVVVLGLVGPNTALETRSAGDETFTNFLLDKMAHYGEWIQKNELDPSTPIPDNAKLPTYRSPRVEMNCTIKNHAVRGHSNTMEDVPVAEAIFDIHAFAIGRQVSSSYLLQGMYDCTGIIYSYANLTTDLPFQGNGNFTAPVNGSTEIIVFGNFGITENYTFNKTHSWTNYMFDPEIASVQLVGSWDSEEVNKYVTVVEGAFIGAYTEFFFLNELESHLYPSRKILDKFLDDIVTTTKLVEVLPAEELPDPYFPRP